MSGSLTIQCPQCQTGYLLPRKLLGASGARVKCPKCGMGFVVTAEEDDAASAADTAPPASARERPREAEKRPAPATVAAEVLEDLEKLLGPRLADARARGKVLAEFGPDVMGAFDEYRRRLGVHADADTFRRVLKARLGIALDPENA